MLTPDRWRDRAEAAGVLVTRTDPDVDPDEGERVEFRLTYAGELHAYRDGLKMRERAAKVHTIRKRFHKQMKALWAEHPVLIMRANSEAKLGRDPMQIFKHDGFGWMPLVNNEFGLICKLEILLLRQGSPGNTVYDLDNRVKTIFDALRKAKGPDELGAGTSTGQFGPDPDEDPFYCLLEDDSLITHVAVSSDTLLEPIPGAAKDLAVRLIMNVTVRPYKAHFFNTDFA